MTAQRIGYGRVSTTDQHLDDQETKLSPKVDRLFLEKYTGTKSSRPEWDRVKEILRTGDTLVITKLDRLGRSSKDLHNIASYLEEDGINLEATEQNIDTSTPEGKMFFSILAAFAEFEHASMKARTMDGLAAARARGRSGGRKAKLTDRQIKKIVAEYEAGGYTVSQIATDYKVSRPTIYRALEARTA